MRIVDTSGKMLESFVAGQFSLEKWKVYMDECIPGAKERCLKDMEDCVNAGFSWKKDFEPVLNSVASDDPKRIKAIDTFHQITDHLDEQIIARFQRTVDVDVILYLGLCNGAGWVTKVGQGDQGEQEDNIAPKDLNNEGRITILLGIEKIMELNWCDKDTMTGLIIHELGHVYQAQYGQFQIATDSMRDHFLWKFFTEGVAMVFEQEIVGNPDYYQQDANGWRTWCDRHLEFILTSFANDIETMTYENQRYFGDWVSFEGYGDTGYYLGTKFVRFMLNEENFDTIIGYGIEEIKERFDRFLETILMTT